MEASGLIVDDLLNFNFEEEEEKNNKNRNTQNALTPSEDASDYLHGLALPDFEEEELEWLSNGDAFPSLESCLDMFPENPIPILNHHSPISVLDNNNNNNNNSSNRDNKNNSITPFSFRCPTKPRSHGCQRRRRPFLLSPPGPDHQSTLPSLLQSFTVMGRKCTHCLVDKTPQWRAGPNGPKTLCNACGVRYKSGRLVPEYRPANSPTFSNFLHSNSHRKVVEMRKRKELGGIAVKEPCKYNRVG